MNDLVPTCLTRSGSACVHDHECSLSMQRMELSRVKTDCIDAAYAEPVKPGYCIEANIDACHAS